ncbi:MAG: glycosyltransferase family 2 protein, partial [Gammaproteobacteria bacterium]
MTIVSNILVCIGVYLSLYVAYWLLLLLTHFLSVTPIARPYRATTKFLIIVPAHNEELLLPRLLDSVRQQDYPRELFTSIVVADN